MAHDSHFLERLLRVDGPQADLALGLYRDPALLRFILDSTPLPDGVDRVAVALEESPGGPHLLVDREGRFVTCLGAGMASDLPVVTRRQLDALRERHQKVADRLGRARQALDSGSASLRLFKRLVGGAQATCREDFQVALDLVPVLESTYLRLWRDATMGIARDLGRACSRAAKVLRSGRGDTELVTRVWNQIWTAAHFSVLVKDFDRRFAEVASADDLQKMAQGFTAEIAMAAIMGPSVHTLWKVGRVGRPLLGPMKRAHSSASRATRWLASALCLGALGLRNEKLRGEIRKALGSRPARFPVADAMPVPVLDAVQRTLELALEGSAEVHEAIVVDAGRHTLWTLLTKVNADTGDWRSPEDIPADVAPAFLSRSPAPNYGDRTLAGLLPVALLWFARTDAPNLFVPRAYMERLHLRNNPDIAVRALAASAPILVAAPAKATDTPGRNERCPCGSNRKYKVCCGAPAAGA